MSVAQAVMHQLLIAALLLCAAAPWPAAAAPAPGPAALVERARAGGLSRDPAWLALLHYERTVRGFGRRSDASADFFLAPDGRTDPAAELDATLEAFFDDALVDGDQTAQCAFIARRHWLTRRLELAPDAFPAQDCGPYQAWRDGLQASGVTFIYPEGFMNNPASMFGHTLLRIDIDEGTAGDEVLGHAVDFTGDVGPDPGMLYLVRGIFGRYPGRFGVTPYYQQLRRYGEWENRDLWEYPLDLSDEELDLLLMHLWELRGVTFPYWFFTRNCSHQLFRLLEVARPDLREADRLRPFVLPVDTVRSVVDHPGLASRPYYRASPATKLQHDLTLLTRGERSLARELSRGERDPSDAEVVALPPARRAAVLTVAYDLLRYAFVSRQTTQEQSQGLARRLLVARSRVRDADESGAPPLGQVETPEVPPEQSHDSAMAEVSAGVRDDDVYIDLRLRPSFHGLLDREGGLDPHMQIRFLDTVLRVYPEKQRVRLQELTVVEAISLSPRDAVFQPIAWRIASGLDTRRVEKGDRLTDGAVFRTDVGAGLAFEPIGWLHTYLLATATLDAGPDLDDGASLGAGATGGVYLRLPRARVKLHAFVDVTRYFAGDPTTALRTGFEPRIALARNWALTASVTYDRIEGRGWMDARAGLRLYF